jgi:hypothetical protein
MQVLVCFAKLAICIAVKGLDQVALDALSQPQKHFCCECCIDMLHPGLGLCL